MGRREAFMRHLRGGFVGRSTELARLSRVLDPDGPIAVFVHGMAGVGKSALLQQFALDARDRGAEVVVVDCRAVEPSRWAVLQAVTGVTDRDVDAALATLPTDRPVAVVLDHYEAFRLVDSWIRLDLVARLPENVGLVIGIRGRIPAGWHPGTDDAAVVAVALDVLTRDESAALLEAAGIAPDAVDHLHHLTHGLPLALQVAAVGGPDIASSASRVALSQAAGALSEAYLQDVDAELRAAVDVLAVTRRASPALLRAVEPGLTGAALSELGRLPFVEVDVDGLRLHDAARAPIAADVALTDPDRHRRIMSTAWEHLQAALADLDDANRWAWMADLLFLVDHPLVREAFFPSGDPQVSVDPATTTDVPDVRAIAAAHLAPVRLPLLDRILDDHLESCMVARDDDGAVLAFSVVLDRTAFGSRTGREDPLLQEVARLVRGAGLPVDHDVLVVYADLHRDTGDRPSEPLAALYLDLKRTYLALHDRLGMVVTVREDPSRFLSHTAPLGFVHAGDVDIGGVRHAMVALRFGPGSVDGWLGRLAARQFGPVGTGLDLDAVARTVRIEGDDLALSKLEFGVLEHLADRRDRPVSRAELIRDVWGTDYLGGSNVVDAVVRTLRGKLGAHADLVETVRGVGYRFNDDVLPSGDRVPGSDPVAGAPAAAGSSRSASRH